MTVDVPLTEHINVNADFRVLKNSPSVLALGRLCCQSGFAFLWAPHEEPVLITPTGLPVRVPLHQFVPIMSGVMEMTPSELEASWQNIRNLAAQHEAENTHAVVLSAFLWHLS